MVEEYYKVKDLVVLKPQDLTNSSINVNKKDLPKYWSREYINERIERITNYKHKFFITFLWKTGLRIGEVINIRKQDIDFNNYTILVRWQKSRKFYYRNVPIHPEIKDVLQLYCVNMKSEEKIFCFSRQRAWQLVKKYFDGNPHRFRHSFAVNWLRCEGDLTILSRLLGHSKIQTTMVYLNIVPIDQGKELLKIRF